MFKGPEFDKSQAHWETERRAMCLKGTFIGGRGGKLAVKEVLDFGALSCEQFGSLNLNFLKP